MDDKLRKLKNTKTRTSLMQVNEKMKGYQKYPEDAFDLFESVVMCDYEWPDVRTQPSKQCIHEADEKTDVNASRSPCL